MNNFSIEEPFLNGQIDNHLIVKSRKRKIVMFITFIFFIVSFISFIYFSTSSHKNISHPPQALTSENKCNPSLSKIKTLFYNFFVPGKFNMIDSYRGHDREFLYMLKEKYITINDYISIDINGICNLSEYAIIYIEMDHKQDGKPLVLSYTEFEQEINLTTTTIEIGVKNGSTVTPANIKKNDIKHEIYFKRHGLAVYKNHELNFNFAILLLKRKTIQETRLIEKYRNLQQNKILLKANDLQNFLANSVDGIIATTDKSNIKFQIPNNISIVQFELSKLLDYNFVRCNQGWKFAPTDEGNNCMDLSDDRPKNMEVGIEETTTTDQIVEEEDPWSEVMELDSNEEEYEELFVMQCISIKIDKFECHEKFSDNETDASRIKRAPECEVIWNGKIINVGDTVKFKIPEAEKYLQKYLPENTINGMTTGIILNFEDKDGGDTKFSHFRVNIKFHKDLGITNIPLKNIRKVLHSITPDVEDKVDEEEKENDPPNENRLKEIGEEFVNTASSSKNRKRKSTTKVETKCTQKKAKPVVDMNVVKNLFQASSVPKLNSDGIYVPQSLDGFPTIPPNPTGGDAKSFVENLFSFIFPDTNAQKEYYVYILIKNDIALEDLKLSDIIYIGFTHNICFRSNWYFNGKFQVHKYMENNGGFEKYKIVIINSGNYIKMLQLESILIALHSKLDLVNIKNDKNEAIYARIFFDIVYVKDHQYREIVLNGLKQMLEHALQNSNKNSMDIKRRKDVECYSLNYNKQLKNSPAVQIPPIPSDASPEDRFLLMQNIINNLLPSTEYQTTCVSYIYIPKYLMDIAEKFLQASYNGRSIQLMNKLFLNHWQIKDFVDKYLNGKEYVAVKVFEASKIHICYFIEAALQHFREACGLKHLKNDHNEDLLLYNLFDKETMDEQFKMLLIDYLKHLLNNAFQNAMEIDEEFANAYVNYERIQTFALHKYLQTPIYEKEAERKRNNHAKEREKEKNDPEFAARRKDQFKASYATYWKKIRSLQILIEANNLEVPATPSRISTKGIQLYKKSKNLERLKQFLNENGIDYSHLI